MIFIESLYFFLLVFLVFFIPGKFLLRVLKFQNKDLLVSSALSVGVGISVFMISSYLLSWLRLEVLYNFFVLGVCLYYLKYLKAIKKIKIRNVSQLEILIITIGSIFTAYIMWRSGSVENGSMVFYGVNSIDAIYHLALIGNLKFNFPPTHPGILGFPLSGYNYFYDLTVAYFSKFYGLQTIDLFFRHFPVFLSVFYGFSAWALGRFMNMKRITIIISLFLLYFAQGFSKTISIGALGSYDPGIVHTVANIVDPSVILSVSLLFLLFIFVFSKRSRLSFILPALILGTLPMIKIYTAFLAFAAVGSIFLMEIIKKKDFYLLKLLLPAAFIAAISYFPANLGSGKLIFAPALLYRHYLESISANNKLDWYLRLLVFEEHSNFIKIIWYKFVVTLSLFYIPSLGLRLVSVVFVKKIFNKSFYSERNIFWIAVVAIGFIIPSFFIQSIAVFVTLQFLWIAYFILLIPASYSLTFLLSKVSRLKISILFLILVLMSFSENYTLYKIYSQNPVKIGINLVNAANKISEIPANDGVIILNTTKIGSSYQSEYTVPIFSALSERSIYFEPEVMEFSNVSGIIDERKEEIAKLNSVLLACLDPADISLKLSEFSKTAKASYILDLKKNPCFDKLKNIELIYTNSTYSLYRSL